jgi:hypothetical protein
MITIDLLKGDGVPAKSKPGGVALRIMPFLVPVIAAVVMMNNYQRNVYLAESLDQSMKTIRAKVAANEDVAARLAKIDEETKRYENYLEEVSGNIDGHMQWSPILAEIGKQLPGEVSISRLKVTRKAERKAVPQAEDQWTSRNVNGHRFTMQITAEIRDVNNDVDYVQEFIRKFRQTPEMDEQIEDMYVVSQKMVADSTPASMIYEIECVFRWKSNKDA